MRSPMKEDRHRDPCGLQIGNRLSNGLVCVFEGIVCFAHHTIPMTATIAATMTSQEKADSSLVVSAALTEGRMVFASLGIMVLYHDAPDGADAQANATKGTFDDSGPPNAAEARRQCSKGKPDRSR